MTIHRSVPHTISVLLIGLRALIGPCLLLDASDGRISPWFLWAFVGGVLSDVIDGELLRRQHLEDPYCRSLDSTTDAVFYMSVFVSMWLVRPMAIRALIAPLTILLSTQACSWLFCLIKFGKTTSYHSYLAKCWGATLFLGTVSFFTSAQSVLLILPIIVGILSHFEDMAITAVLPFWKTDVTSLRAAWHLRQERTNQLAHRSEGGLTVEEVSDTMKVLSLSK